MICDVTGVIPKEVEILIDQEVVVEVEDQSSIVEVSRGIQGLFHWGEANESTVIVEGQETRALLDSGSQLSAYFMDMGKEIKFGAKATPIHFTD